MGHGKWSDVSYLSYAAETAAKPREKVFLRRKATDFCESGQEVAAEKIKYRESRDSPEYPCATPIMVGFDVSGSMGAIPDAMVKGGLETFVGQLLQRKPVTDAHMLFMAIGDAVAEDRYPLQATQFEADNRICTQITDLILEGGGGGNCYESYDLAWAFAAYRTRTDAWEKRKAKGYLFTVGDEEFPQNSSMEYMRKVFSNDCPQAPTPALLLEACQERYHTFHVVILEGNHCRHKERRDRVIAGWKQRLQRRALLLDDYRRLPELLVSAMAIQEGEDLEDILGWWDQSVAGTIRRALAGDVL